MRVIAPCGFNASATLQPQLLNSPGWPHLYSNSLTCEWNLFARPGMVINFTVTTFETEECCDFLSVSYTFRRMHLESMFNLCFMAVILCT